MDYEKEYKGALERAKKLYEQGTITESLSYIFPEIKECNEEEVREAMIDFFKHEREEGVVVSHYGVNIERMIAWLEKQKTSEEAIQYLKENHSPSEVSDFQTAMNIAIAKAYDKGVKDGLENKGQTFTKKEVDDAYLAGVRDAKKELEKQSEQNSACSDEDERIRKALINGFNKLDKSAVWYNGITNGQILAWLEKQKAVDILDEEEREFSDNVDSYRKEVDAAYQKGYNEGVKATLEKQDKKPADRVKLMFKVGDWIIYDRHISKVKDMDSEGYLVEDTYGDEGILPKEFAEKHYHLWTIAEAEDGDVLADNVGVILFKSIGDNNVINFHAYFSGLFAVQEGEHYWGHIRESTLSPATKEQRERFFAAMHDAGYEWDAEKKELKKISQRMISAEAKEAMYGNPAWSEEDENEVAILEAYIRSGEWSESHIDRALGIVDELVNKVKSLKPQKHWKPNDTELEVLRLVAEKDGTCLMGLYEQLKKLREE